MSTVLAAKGGEPKEPGAGGGKPPEEGTLQARNTPFQNYGPGTGQKAQKSVQIKSNSGRKGKTRPGAGCQPGLNRKKKEKSRQTVPCETTRGNPKGKSEKLMIKCTAPKWGRMKKKNRGITGVTKAQKRQQFRAKGKHLVLAAKERRGAKEGPKKEKAGERTSFNYKETRWGGSDVGQRVKVAIMDNNKHEQPFTDVVEKDALEASPGVFNPDIKGSRGATKGGNQVWSRFEKKVEDT